MSLVVSGLARCGTSLMMQMLAAGGVPCSGRYPAYEHKRVIDGYATKILDPQDARSAPLPPDAKVIWLDRDTRQQALSHAKFLRLVVGVPLNREGRRQFETSLQRDRLRAMVAIGGRRPLLVLQFEDVLADPARAARCLGAFVGGAFDAQAAARQVLPRRPECASDMGIELRLMRAGRLAA